MGKCFIFLFFLSGFSAQAQFAELEAQSLQKQSLELKTHIEFEAKSTRDKSSNEIDGHESEVEFKFSAMKTKNFGWLVSTKLNNMIRSDDDQAQDVTEYAIGIHDSTLWFGSALKFELCYFWLREPAEIVQLGFKQKAKVSSLAQFKWRLQLNQIIKSLDDKFEKHSFKVEMTPVYTLGSWGVGPQIKINQKGWLTRDEYTISVQPFVKYEMDHLEVMLRQIFKIAQFSQKSVDYSWQESSVTSLQVELDF